MKLSSVLPFVASAAAAMVFAGCVMTPYDGELIANYPTTVIPQISGFSNVPSQTITVYAKDSGGSFEAVATTTTAESGFIWNDTEWYYYNLRNLDLDAEYWTPKSGGACGAKATLRVKLGSGSIYGMSMKEPFADCFEYDMEAAELVETCASDNSPSFTVETCGALCC
jgi:hypothetical protein